MPSLPFAWLCRRWLSAVLLVFCCLTPPAWPARVVNDAMLTRPMAHHLWQHVLNEAVSETGEVDFDRLRAYPRRLNQYLDQLAQVSPQSDTGYFPAPADELAYWINAYNALALRLVLDRYPVDSPDTVAGLKTDRRYRLGGTAMSLADIEAVLAGRFYHQPDYVFALTAYALDDPPVAGLAYRGETIRAQLAAQAERYWADRLLWGWRPPEEGGGCLRLALTPGLRSLLFGDAAEPFAGRLEGRPDPWLLLKSHLPPEVQADWGRRCVEPLPGVLPARRQLRRFAR